MVDDPEGNQKVRKLQRFTDIIRDKPDQRFGLV
jgi:hypothetical protein